jgi:hypothetical protein
MEGKYERYRVAAESAALVGGISAFVSFVTNAFGGLF